MAITVPCNFCRGQTPWRDEFSIHYVCFKTHVSLCLFLQYWTKQHIAKHIRTRHLFFFYQNRCQYLENCRKKQRLAVIYKMVKSRLCLLPGEIFIRTDLTPLVARCRPGNYERLQLLPHVWERGLKVFSQRRRGADSNQFTGSGSEGRLQTRDHRNRC